MTSRPSNKVTTELTAQTSDFVTFIYLDRQTQAVPAGRISLVEHNDQVLRSTFGYGRQYVQRPNRLALDPLTLALPGAGEELLREPPQTAKGQLTEFGVVRDAAPDRWGRRVIENKLRRTGPLPESIYLAHAGSNRTGALDFRATPDAPEQAGYLAQLIDLGYLKEAAERIDAGEPIPASLDRIFDAGSSMGGARPKAVIEADQRQWLAKFALASDAFSMPDVEYATLLMARAAGLDVPDVRLEEVGDQHPVMLIERFDRQYQTGNTVNGGKPATKYNYARRHFISALTLLAKHESESPHTSYAQIAEAIAIHGAAATIKQDQAELFGRMIFNILVNNNDDHLRNHGFIWDASPKVKGWRLSKLYDVVPAPSHATERYLHLAVGHQGRLATLPNALSQHGVFGLSKAQAIQRIESISAVVREWKSRFEAAGVPGQDIDRISSAFRRPRELGLNDLKDKKG
jgi:serine/threonine-protein kinase HipA